MRILIADDDAITLALLRSLLSSWGYEVVIAEDGEQARALLLAGGIHVCILDWEMPRLNGRDLCWWIKSAELAPPPYVIMLTGRTRPQDIRTGYAAGADDYISKPMNPDDLRFRLAAQALRALRHEAVEREMSRLDPVEMYRHDLLSHDPKRHGQR